jgi:hypothetical protein
MNGQSKIWLPKAWAWGLMILTNAGNGRISFLRLDGASMKSSGGSDANELDVKQ